MSFPELSGSNIYHCEYSYGTGKHILGNKIHSWWRQNNLAWYSPLYHSVLLVTEIIWRKKLSVNSASDPPWLILINCQTKYKLSPQERQLIRRWEMEQAWLHPSVCVHARICVNLFAFHVSLHLTEHNYTQLILPWGKRGTQWCCNVSHCWLWHSNMCTHRYRTEVVSFQHQH